MLHIFRQGHADSAEYGYNRHTVLSMKCAFFSHPIQFHEEKIEQVEKNLSSLNRIRKLFKCCFLFGCEHMRGDQKSHSAFDDFTQIHHFFCFRLRYE